jgi:hypothetical protein
MSEAQQTPASSVPGGKPRDGRLRSTTRCSRLAPGFASRQRLERVAVRWARQHSSFTLPH